MTDTDDNIDWALLERHLAGETSPTEEAWMRAWLEQDSSHAEALECYRRIWTRSRSEPDRYDVEDGWQEMAVKLDAPAEVPVRRLPQRQGAPRRREWRRAMIRIAAVLVLIVSGGALTQVMHRWGGSASEAIAMQEVTTARGQRATVRLADGSKIVLGPGSHISAPERFDRNTRTVTLEGEGFFEVARDEDRPFLIQSRGAVTRVLGTSFVVRAYRDDPEVRVVVKSGRVRLGAEDEPEGSAELIPGQIGRLNDRGEVAVETAADVDAYLGWIDNKLIFQDAPLSRVAADLERWYDVEVTVADGGIADYPLTATFDRQPLDEVLTVIERSLDVRYIRDDRSIHFTAGPPTRR